MTVATKERVVFSATIDVDPLLAVVGRVRGVIDRRSTIPVLANFKLEAADGRLFVTGTDLDIEVTDRAECVGEGATTVNAEQLTGLLAKMPRGAECSLSVTGADPRLILKCGRSTYRLAAIPVSDFPSMSDEFLGAPITVEAGDLEALIDKTAFAICAEATRHYICGARLHIVNDGAMRRLRMVATNGRLLALAEVEAPEAYDAAALTVPTKTVREIARLLDAAGETIALRLSSQKIRASGGSWTLTSKVIDGDYALYERVIPADNTRAAIIDRKLLVDALGRLTVIAGDESKAVRAEFSEGHIHLSLRSTDGDSAQGDEEIEAGFTGTPLSIGFNAGLLLEILARIDDANVEIRLAEAARDSTTVMDPALILDPSNPRVRYVLVPLRA